MAAPPPAAGGVYVSQNMDQTMEETRTELRQLSFKLSKCEIALESHGSYLGITDPVILLDQLKALQRKDEQLREIFLILLRTSPLHAPQPRPSRLANAAALLPAPPPPQGPPPQAPPAPAASPRAPPLQAPPRQAPRPSRATLAPALTAPSPTTHAPKPPAPTPLAPTTHAPKSPAPTSLAPTTHAPKPPAPTTLALTPPAATAVSGRTPNPRRSCTLLETNARRKHAPVAATNASAAASASAAPPSTPLPRPPPPPTPAKISTPVEALTPSPLWSSSPSHLTPRPKTTPAVPPGKTLSLYEALGLTPPPKASAPAPATGQSAHPEITNNGSGDTSRSSTPPVYFPGRHTLYRAIIPRGEAVGGAGGSAIGGNPPGGVRGEVSSSSPAAGLPRRGYGAGIEDSNGHAERGRFPATTLASSTTGGRSNDEGTRAPESESPANPPKNGDSASGGGASSTKEIGSTLVGAGAGQGALGTATEMATVALADPAEERVTMRELADVATAFNMKSSRVSSPAPAEGQERVAGSGARNPSMNDIHRDGDNRMAVEGQGTTAVASPGATASTGAPPSETMTQSKAVAPAVGKMAKKELVQADGNGGGEVVVGNPARSGRAATSTRGTKERQRRTPTRPLRVSPRLTRSSAAAIAKSAAPTDSTNPSPTCSTDSKVGTLTMQQGVETAKPPARASSTPPGNASPSGKSESAFGEDVAAKKPPVEMVPAGPDADAPRRGNGDDKYGGRPPRKRRKSAQTGGWRSRYNADEFELGKFSSSSRSSSSSTSDSDTESDGDMQQPRDDGVGVVGSVGAGGNDEGDAEWDETLVDVGGDEDSDEDEFGDDGGREVGGDGSMKRVRLVRKLNPPNAWKRRCADGTCLVGASFGFEGKQAVYCSAHKDAGMVNVTHRRCEEPGCNHQPSFNTEGERAMYCRAHKRNGMINVSSPRCHSPECRVRPSFGFDGDARATYCDGHKKPSMVNVRKRNHRASREIHHPSSTSENERSENGSLPYAEHAASAPAAVDLPWYSVKHKTPPLDDLTPQPLYVYDPHVSPDSSIAQDSPLHLPSASTATPAEIAAAAHAPTAPGPGTDDDEVDRVDVGGGASGTSAGGPRKEEVVSSAPGVSSG